VTPAGAIASGGFQDQQLFLAEAFAQPGDPQPVDVIPDANLPYEGQANTALFFSAAFSPDERWMAVQNADGEVALWDLEKKALLGSRYAPAGANVSIAGFADGILVVSSDQETIVWDLDTSTWADKACQAAGRNLTESEWETYFPGREYEVTCEQWPAKPEI
jgi:WD40 repeat protein